MPLACFCNSGGHTVLRGPLAHGDIHQQFRTHSLDMTRNKAPPAGQLTLATITAWPDAPPRLGHGHTMCVTGSSLSAGCVHRKQPVQQSSPTIAVAVTACVYTRCSGWLLPWVQCQHTVLKHAAGSPAQCHSLHGRPRRPVCFMLIELQVTSACTDGQAAAQIIITSSYSTSAHRVVLGAAPV
jgi:hypothetical protein